MYTILCRRGYSIRKSGADEAKLKALREELVARPAFNPNTPGGQQGATPFPLWRENSTKFYMPPWYGISKYGAPSSNRIEPGAPAPGLIFKGTLRPHQLAPTDAFLASEKGGILVLECAAGKTTMGLYLAAQYQRRTLVVCHKEFLMNQWIERIQQFLPEASIGRIQRDKFDVEGRDIVIASLQTIAMRDFPREAFDSFHFAIVDEAHHIGAEVFSRALHKIQSPVMLGLTATPDRRDGLRYVFEWFLGPVVYQSRKREDSNLLVYFEPYTSNDPAYYRLHYLVNRKLNGPKMINQVTDYMPRNERLVEILMEVLEKEPGRRALIISERKNQLKLLASLIEARLPEKSLGYYIGGMKQEALDKSNQCDIILGTVAMISEGYDNTRLNVLVLASPMSNIEQAVGRVQRVRPEEREYTPIVIDLWDQIGSFEGQGKRRRAFYKKNKYELVTQKEISSDSDTGPPKYEFIEI